MSFFEAVILGAVQGITEFIPISSSGHLVLVPAALDWDQPSLAFDVLLHLASLVALVAYFRDELAALATGLVRNDPKARRMTFLLAIGTFPAVIAGLAWGDYFERAFEDAEASAIQLVITAAILIAAELALRYNRMRRQRTGRSLREMDDLNAGDAGVVGVAQAISILPGISRSGATIAAGVVLAVERDDAARFAFLLAIPALFGASLLELPNLANGDLGIGVALGGFVTSLITSYAAIAGLIRYLQTRTLYPFAAYSIVAGVFFYFVV